MQTPTQNTALVSGASSGIGAATALLLLAHGYRVIGIARDFSNCSITHEHFKPVCMDLSDLEQLPNRLAVLHKDEPHINSLVCCAGSGRFGSLEEFSYAQINAQINLNLTSHIYLVRALITDIKNFGNGNIVFIGSESALNGGKRGAVYSATKFGLRGLAQSLRQECATNGVRISIINPGMVKTDFFKELDFQHGDATENYILPEDVATAVLTVMEARQGTVFDEINLSPQKKVIRFTGRDNK